MEQEFYKIIQIIIKLAVYIYCIYLIFNIYKHKDKTRKASKIEIMIAVVLLMLLLLTTIFKTQYSIFIIALIFVLAVIKRILILLRK